MVYFGNKYYSNSRHSLTIFNGFSLNSSLFHTHRTVKKICDSLGMGANDELRASDCA